MIVATVVAINGANVVATKNCITLVGATIGVSLVVATSIAATMV